MTYIYNYLPTHSTPDMVPIDFWLFPKLKTTLYGCFHAINENKKIMIQQRYTTASTGDYFEMFKPELIVITLINFLLQKFGIFVNILHISLFILNICDTQSNN